MKKHLLFFILCFSMTGFSQELLMDTEDVHAADIIEPKFNGGGVNTFHQFVNQGFDLSKITKAGKIVVSFTINTVGEIKNIRVLEFTDVESATEIIRVIQKAPKWEPAKRGGKPFSVDIKLPFVFTMNPVPSQENSNVSKEKSSGQVSIEKKPEFPGGRKEFNDFISKNYKMPNVKGISGKVLVSFVIEKDGSVVDITVIKDLGYGTGAEAIRVLSICPKWIPGEHDGKQVRVKYTLPINVQSK